MPSIISLRTDIAPQNAFHYLAALEFDPEAEGPTARGLQAAIGAAKQIVVETIGCKRPLVYNGPMESPLLNLGDYREMKNVGGTFPVGLQPPLGSCLLLLGEVISELVDLTRVSGDCTVFSFADVNKHLCIPPESFRITIEKGQIVDYDREKAPQEFVQVMDVITKEEGEVWIREFGLGLNKAMGKGRIVDNITTFERMLGLHISVGKKHNVFKGRSKSMWHLDVFLDLERIVIDDKVVYKDNAYYV